MTKYFVDEKEVDEFEFSKSLYLAVDEEITKDFDEYIDECCESYKINGMEINASEILKECRKMIMN